MKPTIFLFGESEKGSLGNPFLYTSLPSLYDGLGAPPEDTLGVHYAVQTILYSRQLLFCRVKEEGFNTQDYIKGLLLLKRKACKPKIQAIFMPGVGDEKILEVAEDVCNLYKSLLVITEKDLYDYLTSSSF